MKKRLLFIMFLTLFLSSLGYSCHISEGILSIQWVIFWAVVFLPFLVWSIVAIIKNIRTKKNYVALLALFGALVFLMTSLAIPSPVAGATSHLAASGISAIILGPVVSIFLGFLTLLIQGLFMAHGGITTLGANGFAMGVVGSFAAFITYKLARLLKLPYFVSGFLAVFIGDLATYLVTSLQLALEFHGTETILSTWMKLYAAFLSIQIPVAILGGIIGGSTFKIFLERAKEYVITEKLT